jgi:gliding motility-associated lipoprotein GldD
MVKWRNGEKKFFMISPFHYLSSMKNLSLIIFILAMFPGCQPDYTPKPRGYFRIDVPRHAYRAFDSAYPYTFEYPVYARLSPDTSGLAEPWWINVVFPEFRAQVHLSYKLISHNLSTYLEDSRTLVNKHIPKATAITQREFLNCGDRVFGLTFAIRGTEAASPYQFYVTDSVSRFVRGALYFYVPPNNDSLAPVIDFLKEDIDHMISTFRWKK